MRALTILALGILTSAGCSTRPDAFPMVDTTPGVRPPVDADRPVGPVVVGPDLVPADYACLGTRAAVASGALVPITVAIEDWADHGPRGDVQIRAASTDGWRDWLDCADALDCVSGVSDATGHATLQLRVGPVWLSTQTPPTSVPARAGVLVRVVGLEVAEGATTLAVPAMSASTELAIESAAGAGLLVVGRVRDCAGAAVSRARLRAFDASGNELVRASRDLGPLVLYPNASGTVTDADRTTIDGVFIARLQQGRVRVEAWGLRELGGPEVLLGCRQIDLPASATTTLADLPPLPCSP